jgi:hypothetical protein
VNALWFRLFGVGLRTLALANLVLLALDALLLRALLRRAGTRRAVAGLAALVFLCVCGCGRLVMNGSFNFVCPYAHEATHGFLLALAALLCALRAGEGRRPPAWTAACGALCGLAFLTKPEPSVAGLGASVLALALARPPATMVRAAAFVAGLAAPVLLAFGLLCAAMPADEAWRGTLGSWAYVFNGDLLGLGYFAWSMGLDTPRANLVRLGTAVGQEALLLLPACGLAFALRGRAWRWAPAAAGVLVLLALAPFHRARFWFGLARPLPLWAVAIAVGAVAAWRL